MTKPIPGAKRGRPPTGIRRPLTIQIRVTEEEDGEIRARALEDGAVTAPEFGEWVRQLVLREVRKKG